MKEFNEISKRQESRYPVKITVQELIRGHHYPIQEMVFIPTQYHSKTVIARILVGDNVRSFFLPEAYANTFRNNFENANEFNCYEMYLVLTGFKDEVNSLAPLLNFVYKGEAQAQ